MNKIEQSIIKYPQLLNAFILKTKESEIDVI